MLSVIIVGRNREAHPIVRALQNAGVVQIDPIESSELKRVPLSEPDAVRHAEFERQLARTESILATIGTGTADEVSPAPETGALGAYLEELGHRVDTLAHERADLEFEAGVISTYRNTAQTVAELAADLDRSPRLAVLAFTLMSERELQALETALREALNANYVLGTKHASGMIVGVLAVRKGDATTAKTALVRAGASELRFPGRFEGLPFSEAARLMDLRSASIHSELARVKDDLERIGNEHRRRLNGARLQLRDEIARYLVLEHAARGQYGFAMRGWLPERNRAQLEAALRPFADGIAYEFVSPDLHHSDEVPVKLENNRLVKPFELLMGIFAPPGYGTFDPTWVIALFFPIFFGFVIGDVGLGLISLITAFILGARAARGGSLNLGPFGVSVPPMALRNLSIILLAMSFWSIVFGVVYGEFFGTLGENIGLFHYKEAALHYAGSNAAEAARLASGKAQSGIPILLHRASIQYADIMLVLALLPGIIQVLYGWLVRVRVGIAHGDRRHIFEGIGMFMGLVGVILHAYVFRNPGTSLTFLTPIAWACLAVFLVCVLLTAKENALGGMMMPVELISNGGNILSYLRLYAVGLSSALLANLATDFAWNIGASIQGVIGIFIGILIASLIHLVAIGLTIIGHVLQPLRLHYAEFFTKFGFFDHSGRVYRPFARLAPFTQPTGQAGD